MSHFPAGGGTRAGKLLPPLQALQQPKLLGAVGAWEVAGTRCCGRCHLGVLRRVQGDTWGAHPSTTPVSCIPSLDLLLLSSPISRRDGRGWKSPLFLPG